MERRPAVLGEGKGFTAKLQVSKCVCHFLGQGGNKRELEAKFGHFFDDCFGIGNCCVASCYLSFLNMTL